MMIHPSLVQLRNLAFVLAMISNVASGAESNEVRYNRDVRPILAEFCFKCHGPDSASRAADLRLDRRDDALAAKAFVPGDVAKSELLLRLESTDPEEVMPPPKTKKTLSAAQKDVLKRWIASGANYESHWSLIPPQPQAVPAVKNVAWPKNEIDNFILARLESQGLEPAPEADRRTLARRLSLDLTGLPPTPEFVESFVADTSGNAYEKVVDALLASERWGEHRGRYWLDAARYADTHGIHFDNFREIWSYREWVIDAFNRNLPFDQFTMEQLAGDLMTGATSDQLVATGFHRCNITTNEGGIIDEEYAVLYARDRTETTATVWLGATMGCCVCHDHKFDPYTMRDFYSLSAFFNNTTQGVRDGNVPNTPPIINMPPLANRARREEIAKKLSEISVTLNERRKAARPEFEKFIASNKATAVSAAPVEGLVLHAPLGEGQGKSVSVLVKGESRQSPITATASWQDGPHSARALAVQGGALEIADAGDFEGDDPYTVAAWLKLPAEEQNGAIIARMDNAQGFRGWDVWIQGRRLAGHVIHSWPQNALKVVAEANISANQWTHVTISYDGSRKAAGVKIFYNGVPQKTLVESDKLKAKSSIHTGVPWKIGQRDTDGKAKASIYDVRVYRRVLAASEIDALAKNSRYADLLARAGESLKGAEYEELLGWWLRTKDDVSRQMVAQQSEFEREYASLDSKGTIAHIMQEKKTPPMANILFRGEYDKKRDPVTPATPGVLPKFPDDFPKNRLGLAKWLLLPEQPLTARVTVNRFWQEVFGIGLVRTTGDLGVSGEAPSHPELLDYLAVEFRSQGWDIKKFFKRIVMSAAYRQSAVTSKAKLEGDPQNRLLCRGPRFRMDAEMVRDYALQTSGLLVPKLGGPSVKPYQPDGVWEAVAMIGSNTRDYRRDSGENLYRRSLYTFWKRSAPPASLETFNAPSREVCSVRRERTNTPLQALVTLNDPQFVEAARRLAERSMQASETENERVDFIARRLLARPLREQELAIVRESLGALVEKYREKPDEAAQLLKVGDWKSDAKLDPVTLAAWTMLTNQLMNLDEVLTK